MTVKYWAWVLLLVLPAAMLAGCGGGDEKQADADPKDQTPAQAESDNGANDGGTDRRKIDTAYISDDFVVAIVAHPARLIGSDMGKDFLRLPEEDAPPGSTLEQEFAKTRKAVGFDPRSLEQAIVLADHETVMGIAGSMTPGPPRGTHPEPKICKEQFRDKSPRGFEKEQDEEFDGKPPGGDEDSFQTALQPDRKSAPKKPPRFDPDVNPDHENVPRTHGEMAGAYILRCSKAVDRKTLLAAIAPTIHAPGGRKTFEPEKREQAGATYWKAGPGNAQSAAFFDDDKTVVIAPEQQLRKMLATKAGESPLARRLALADGRNDVIVCAAGPAVEEQVKQFAEVVPAEALPPEFRDVPKFAGSARSLTVSLSVTGDNLLSVAVQLGDEAAAAGMKDLAVKHVPSLLKQQLQQVVGRKSVDAKLRRLYEQVVAGTSFDVRGNEFLVSVKRPEAAGELQEMVVKGVRAAREAARNSQRRNHLKQVGLALHNYHDTYGGMPGPGSNADGSKKGLSWRVHLLPLLEEQKLYNRFKLDEPWDSQHNKMLVQMMPSVFVDPIARDLQVAGKTRFHVFVGKGTPFGREDRGPRLSDITDGTSNTLMVVEAAPDKADVWTKPGGLPFDPEKNPFDAIGTAPNGKYNILLFDGRVTTMPSSTPPEMLKFLIQHNVGELVPEF